MNNQQLAIQVIDAIKYYGFNNNENVILNKFNLYIPKGFIYGLLGPSGCGKTSLLNCMVGLSKLNSGEIWVLNEKVGEPGSMGSKIGFMPQTMSLINEFTVDDILYYYGRIFNINKKKLEQRVKYLRELLELPTDNRFIQYCSGGEKRRISLAISLVHEPELLILDEPTVGLDPILNSIIWKSFHQITKEKKVTILLTTHYIEETRQTDLIGLMRNGKLLCQESPNILLNHFNVATLEEVFLILSSKSNDDPSQINKIQTINESNAYCPPVISYKALETDDQRRKELETNKNKYFNFNRFRALLTKQFLAIVRNYTGIGLTIILPMVMIISTITALGQDPKNITFGIVNDEISWENCTKYSDIKLFSNNNTCDTQYLSCNLINRISLSNLKKVFFNDVESAKNYSLQGQSIGYIHFKHNFTEALLSRMVNHQISTYDLEASKMDVSLDMSHLFGPLLKNNLYQWYYEFVGNISKECNGIMNRNRFPFQHNIVYGKLQQPFLLYTNPACLTLIIHFMAVILTCIAILIERSDGNWHRSLVAGVKYSEILSSHFLVEFCILLIVNFEVVFIDIYVFDLKPLGSLYLLAFLLIVQTIMAMLTGLLISIGTSSLIAACAVVIGYYFTSVFLTGVVWPIQGLQTVLYIWSVYFTPLTLPIQAIRAVYNKGWTIWHYEIYISVISCTIWIVVLAILCLFILRIKK